MIGHVDKKDLILQRKREKRVPKYKNKEFQLSLSVPIEKSNSQSKYKEKNRILKVSENELDVSQPSTSANLSEVPLRNLKTLPVLAKTLDRYGVSDRAGAAIASAVLQDYGVIKNEDNLNVIDRHKVRRARDNQRQKLQKSQSDAILLKGLYFDGRKDKTLFYSDNRKRTSIEEHIVLLQEPDSIYLGHISPVSGSAQNIVKSMLEFFHLSSISTDHLQVVGCDGTNSNTGHKGGVITLLEHRIKRPLQWFICELHANELPLRHLVQHLDGNTSGPRAFQGPIGGALNECEKLPIAKFQVISSTLPDISFSDLGTDQKYLFDICQAIINGTCSESMSKRNPGRLNHSRWLTTANRILRLYVASENPSEELLVLATFVMKVYAPMWFVIKSKPSCVYGAKHVFETIKLCRYLPDELKTVVYPVIQRNGYFGHPENLLISMLWDESSIIRKLAVLKILKARRNENSVGGNSSNTVDIRKFTIPTFNFDATAYYDLIDWQNVSYSEPPITKRLSEEQLWQIVEEPQSSAILHIKDYPCHTQAVERAIKLVTQASSTVCDKNRRDGVIRSTLESRNLMPKFETKKDFQN